MFIFCLFNYLFCLRKYIYVHFLRLYLVNLPADLLHCGMSQTCILPEFTSHQQSKHRIICKIHNPIWILRKVQIEVISMKKIYVKILSFFYILNNHKIVKSIYYFLSLFVIILTKHCHWKSLSHLPKETRKLLTYFPCHIIEHDASSINVESNQQCLKYPPSTDHILIVGDAVNGP